MDTGEEQPFAPVHVTELVVPPHDVEVRLGVGLEHDGNQAFAQRFDIRQQLLARVVCGSPLKHIIDVWWLLATLDYAADRAFVKGGDAANVRKDVSSAPFSFFWNGAKGGGS